MKSACRTILCAVVVAMTPASSGFAQVAINEVQRPLFSPPATLMSMPDDASGGPGSDAYVTISAAPGNGSGGIYGIDMTLTYDKNVLEFVSAEVFGDAITLPSPPPVCSGSNFGLAYENNATTGTLVISEFSQCDALQVVYPNSGVIARMKFHVLGSDGATSALNFIAVSINEGAIDATIDNGIFTVNCVGAANGTACDDSTVCNGHETCQNNVCASGTALDCDDHNVCTTDSCAPIAGCQHGSEPTSTPCGTPGQCDNQDFCNGAGSCTDNGFKSAAAPCTGASQTGACDNDAADHCSGTSIACVDVFQASSFVCRSVAAGGCDVAESCTGSSGTCPTDGFASSSTSCAGASQTGACDNNAADHCLGTANSCVDVFQASSFVCRSAAAGGCDVAESCTGSSGTCPADGFASSSTTCTGASQSGACDDNASDHCSGTANSCVDVFRSSSVVCRSAAAGGCDVAESCTGSSGSCPADGFASSSTLCTGTSQGGACDNNAADHCSGTSIACVDVFQASSFVCRSAASGGCDVAESCTGSSGTCPADGFASSSTPCTGASQGGACDDNASDHCSGTANSCVDVFQASSFVCRSAAGGCDVAESCTGSSGTCPADGFASSSTPCAGASQGGACNNDAADHCSGTANSCVDVFQASSFVCRSAAAGGCDVAESCTGSSGTCPADGFASSSTSCTGASQGGACDNNAADHCLGTANSCVDVFHASSFVCRSAAAGGCDVAESCTGSSGTCPTDGFASSSTPCTGASQGGSCDNNAADHCSGTSIACMDVFQASSFVCRSAAAGGCDVAESCTGSSGTCPTDGFASSSTPCPGGSQTGSCDNNAADHCLGTANSCVDVFQASSFVCRSAASGGCDVAESCTGSSGTCPADGFASSSTPCAGGSQGGACNNDAADHCSGTSVACVDVFQSAATACGNTTTDTECDRPDHCSGTSAACDPNYASTSTPCGDGEGPCTNPDACDGLGVCHDNGYKGQGTLCRGSAGACDAGATCDGMGPVCPPNVYTCSVGGTVVYYRDDAGAGSEPSAKPVSSVPVNLGGFANGNTTSNASGAYSFGGLFGNVTITSGALWGGARATTHSGVISSLDASAIARAAVHMITLTANQTIAGDVTGDQTISAFDASFVARYAALLVDHFPVSIASGSDWSFLPVSYSYSPIGASQAGKNFSAILYGDVTGNWNGPAPLQGLASSSRNQGSPEAVAADEALIDLGRQLTSAQLEPARTSQPVELTMSGGTTPLRAGEQRSVVINLQNADAILGLDLSLTYDPSRIAIVDAQATGIGSGFNVAQSSQQGTCRIAAYGIAPLSGSGSVMIVTVKALQPMGRGAPLKISAVANEGAIPIVVTGGNGRLLPRLVEGKSGFAD